MADPRSTADRAGAVVSRRTLAVRAGVMLAIVSCGWFAAARATESSASRMVEAAQAFTSALSAGQRPLALFDAQSPERLRWHFIPNEMFARKGLAFRAMTPAQRELAHALLRSGLSAQGYLTATTIIQLEDVLRDIERSPRFARSPLDYHVSIFGTPSLRGQWGWRLEGHHLSLHFFVENGRVTASSPAFTGAAPATVPHGPRQGARVLSALEDAGRAMVESLDDAQKRVALLGHVAPSDIVSANKHDIAPLAPPGLPVAKMTGPQRAILLRLIGVYTSLMAEDIAAERFNRVRAGGLEAVTFAWAGPLTRGAKHYYRVQGPTFLIEFDNTQNDANHIHAVWRDFDEDFGRDVLREHLAADHAPVAGAAP